MYPRNTYSGPGPSCKPKDTFTSVIRLFDKPIKLIVVMLLPLIFTYQKVSSH